MLRRGLVDAGMKEDAAEQVAIAMEAAMALTIDQDRARSVPEASNGQEDAVTQSTSGDMPDCGLDVLNDSATAWRLELATGSYWHRHPSKKAAATPIYLCGAASIAVLRVEADVVDVPNGEIEVKQYTVAAQALKLTRLWRQKLIVGKGLYNYYNELYVERLINESGEAVHDAVTVNLTVCCSDVAQPGDSHDSTGRAFAYFSVSWRGYRFYTDSKQLLRAFDDGMCSLWTL
ncbi:hypothetical protein FQA39_LY18922 [Lamprigera yunnana]|nr:hypothetical protein FQA39_LY18922 [Lamprigera yunnana]